MSSRQRPRSDERLRTVAGARESNWSDCRSAARIAESSNRFFLPNVDRVGLENFLEQLIIVRLGLRQIKGLDGDFGLFLLFGDDRGCERIISIGANMQNLFHA